MKHSIENIKKNRTVYLSILIMIIGLFMYEAAAAQIPPNAVNADPSAKSITQVPLSATINGSAVMKFKFTNEATSVNSTGQIPANSVRLTISFPGQFAYTSVNSIPKFVIEDADPAPFGVVHLMNNALILEGEVVDLLLNVRGTATGSGTVTFNADRITPIIVGNTQTSNDNAASSFTTTGVLPLKLLSFTAQKQNCTANLAWKTTNEVNIDHFEAEMSNDGGATFTRIGTLPQSTAAAAEKNYTFSYVMQSSLAHLFRVKIIDRETGVSYSPIVRINSGCSQTQDVVTAYPSPAKSVVTLNVTDAALFNTKATVVDVNGKTQFSFTVNGTAVTIDVSKLSAGMYIIRLTNGMSVRFLKE